MISLVFLVAAAAAAADPIDAPVEARRSAFELVGRLGHTSFKVRDQAAHDLARLGAGAVDALRRGLTDPDAEISERCRRLLPQALDLHVQQQIAAFLAMPSAELAEDLPGVRRWLDLAGRTKESKELYALMMKEQRRVLIDIEQNPELVTQRFLELCRDVSARVNQTSMVENRKESVSHSEVLLFLFLGSDPKCRNENAGGNRLNTQALAFLNSNHLAAMLSGPGASEGSKKLFLAWLEQERSSFTVRRGLGLAVQAKLKECVPIALKMAADKNNTAAVRSLPLLSGSKLVGPEHLDALAPLLKDSSVISRTSVNGESLNTEVRDVALAIAVQATGQKTSDYGFDRLRDQPSATSPIYFALAEQKRTAAFKQWAEWEASQSKKK